MKLTVNRNELTKALRLAKIASGGNSSLPVLGCALLRAEADTLTVTGTNMEQRLSVALDAEVAKEGCVVLSMDRLGAVLSRAAADRVTLEVDAKAFVSIDAGAGRKAKLAGLKETEFAADFEPEREPRKFEVTGLAAMLDRVTCAISKDAGRPVLNGALFAAEKGIMKLVATDGRRLHLAQTPQPDLEDFAIIVPTLGVRAIRELVAASGTVSLEAGERTLLVRAGRRELRTKLIDLTFPNYKLVIPDVSDRVMTAPADDLASAIDAASVCASDMQAMEIEAEKAGLRLRCETPEVGESTAFVEAPQATDLRLKINFQFLKEAIDASGRDLARMEMADAQSPMVFREEDFVAVIMPFRVG